MSMWPFKHNKASVPDVNAAPKKPRIRDLWVQMKLVRTHIAGIHSMLNTANVRQIDHEAHLQHIVTRLEAIEQHVRPNIPGHLAPDDQGRPATDPEHGLPPADQRPAELHQES